LFSQASQTTVEKIFYAQARYAAATDLSCFGLLSILAELNKSAANQIPSQVTAFL